VRNSVVGLLRAGETASIDAVIDVLVNQRIDPIDLGAKCRRIEIRGRIAQLIERTIEHPNDLGRFITHNVRH
jgi:predicted YcjX-like family ATPase